MRHFQILVAGAVLLAASLILAATQKTQFVPGDTDARSFIVRNWFANATLWLGVACVAVFLIGLVLDERDRTREPALDFDDDEDEDSLDAEN